MDMKTYKLEELLSAKAWSTGCPGRVMQTPQAINEQAAIEIALRFLCASKGVSKVIIEDLLRPDYGERPSYVRLPSKDQGKDQRGWQFWFSVPGPGISGFSFPLFVGDPSGVVEIGDMI